MRKVPNTPALSRPPFRADINALFRWAGDIVRSMFNALTDHAFRLNRVLPVDGSEAMTGPMVLVSYTVATLPSAATYVRGVVYVSDETGGAVPAFSDGTNWRRVTDRAVVS